MLRLSKNAIAKDILAKLIRANSSALAFSYIPFQM